MALELISNNAFRVLGVYANSPKRTILSNKSKFEAFLRVNQEIPSQRVDLPNLLPPVKRDLEAINSAEGNVSVSKERMTQCMFWFVNTGSKDDEGVDFLAKGNIDAAIRLWKSEGSIGSLQNLMVCYLILARYREAIVLANNILTIHISEWRELFSLLPDVSVPDVSHLFLESLFSAVPKELTSLDWNGMPKEWERYIKEKSTTPLADQILKLIEQCKSSNGDNPEERYKDGSYLLDNAQPLLKELESLLNSDDITLRSLEDKLYSEVLNCCIASYNAVYDELNKGDDNPYRQIVPLCNELANRIDVSFVSSSVAKRVDENKKIINEKCKNIEKTLEEQLAFNDHICWFCGANGNMHELKKPYSYSVSEPTWNGTKTTTYTKTVTIHICDDCQKELAEREKWKYYSAAMIFVLAMIVILIFCDFWIDMEVVGWLFLSIVVGIGSILLGKLTGGLVRSLMDKKNIRKFKREVDDHPLVKYVKSEGYR